MTELAVIITLGTLDTSIEGSVDFEILVPNIVPYYHFDAIARGTESKAPVRINAGPGR